MTSVIWNGLHQKEWLLLKLITSIGKYFFSLKWLVFSDFLFTVRNWQSWIIFLPYNNLYWRQKHKFFSGVHLNFQKFLFIFTSLARIKAKQHLLRITSVLSDTRHHNYNSNVTRNWFGQILFGKDLIILAFFQQTFTC